jgi:hypothetical protein
MRLSDGVHDVADGAGATTTTSDVLFFLVCWFDKETASTRPQMARLQMAKQEN